LEDWAKLRRKMTKDSVRVLLGDPLTVAGYGQEVWTFPFNGSATFSSDGKLESWQVPGTSAR
jgi:outer membrane protein assembly factor BamE (lipoprotein component of BamABCDE complex)